MRNVRTAIRSSGRQSGKWGVHRWSVSEDGRSRQILRDSDLDYRIISSIFASGGRRSNNFAHL